MLHEVSVYPFRVALVLALAYVRGFWNVRVLCLSGACACLKIHPVMLLHPGDLNVEIQSGLRRLRLQIN